MRPTTPSSERRVVVTKPDGSLVLEAGDNAASDTFLEYHMVNVTLGLIGWGDYFIDPGAPVPSRE